MRYQEYQMVNGMRILVGYKPTIRLRTEMLMWNVVYFFVSIFVSIGLRLLGGRFVLIKVDELKYIKERETFWIASLAKKNDVASGKRKWL